MRHLDIPVRVELTKEKLLSFVISIFVYTFDVNDSAWWWHTRDFGCEQRY